MNSEDWTGTVMRRKQMVTTAMIIMLALCAGPAVSEDTNPFESERFTPNNTIDAHVLACLGDKGIRPARLCSDAVFVRRVYLDMIGTLPTPVEARAFIENTSADRRRELIETLFTRDEFADYWALKWGDILRVRAEFPINLWPNGVQAYHRYIHTAVGDNKPYDEFVRELLTSSGSNFRVPPVNFYRAIQGKEPSAITSAVALTFMGTRLESWPEEDRKNLEAFFSRVHYKGTKEWKEEIIFLDPTVTEPLEATFPDGTTVQIPVGEDPREVFADWLIGPENEWFARSICNRVWSWFLGRGIIHEPDDIRPDNPPVNPALLEYLQTELVDSGYDLRHLYRLILNSATYQQSSVPQGDYEEATRLFACYPVRRLDAEVLNDALCYIGGVGQGYSSQVPEPFTFIPESHRSITIPDGSITGSFLEMFGKPSRDSGFESERNNNPTDAQRLSLLNSTDVRRKIEQSPVLRRVRQVSKWRPPQMITGIYLTLLSRYPTADELAAAGQYFQTPDLNKKQAADDIAWALVNSKEFLYRH